KLEDGLVVTVRDVSARRRDQEVQKLLAQELNHRVKNMLATVTSMTSLSGRGAPSVAEFRDRLLGRLQAMSRAHGLLVSSSWEDASVDEVVRAALEPHMEAEPDRFAVDGPQMMIAPDTALALNMALHELATNAVKYGALAHSGGRIAIGWRIDECAPAF